MFMPKSKAPYVLFVECLLFSNLFIYIYCHAELKLAVDIFPRTDIAPKSRFPIYTTRLALVKTPKSA